MEEILGSFERENPQDDPNGGHGALHLTSADLNPNMDDVMKVISDLGDEFPDTHHDDNAQDDIQMKEEPPYVPPVDDKVELAKKKIAELTERQNIIEDRYENLMRRLNTYRSKQLGNFIYNELAELNTYCKSRAPPPPPPTASQMNQFPIIPPKPTNVPDGVVLPSVPSTEVMMSTTSTTTVSTTTKTKTTSTSTSSVVAATPNTSPKVETVLNENVPETVRQKENDINRLTLEARRKNKEILGQMNSHLRHLMSNYDSDATESSSGGESCDELENFAPDGTNYAPIKQRAKWRWLSNRASISSKWTWLTAQIADLEYRIRQQTEFYRNMRANKGAVTLGEPVISWPPHAKKPVQSTVRPDQDVPLNCKPVTKDYSRVDATGRKIIIKEPQMTSAEAAYASDADTEDNSLGASRTRPIKVPRRRKIIPIKDFYQTNPRAAKESSVKCDCVSPNFNCAICLGRRNHSMVPDPVSHDLNYRIALLDHSYHQILSTKDEMPLDLHMMQKLKSNTWNASYLLNMDAKDPREKKKVKRVRKDDAKGENGEKKAKKRTLLKGSAVGRKDKLAKKRSKHDPRRRKSLSVHHHGDDKESSMLDMLDSDGDTISGFDGSSPVPSPSVPASNQAWAEHIKRKRETAFDIDNIVIPYSMAAATRVERLKYKEILTPTWRNVPTDSELSKSLLSDNEDISDTAYEIRHAKAELEEQKRWLQPLWKSSGGQRSRSRRQDSCRTEASSGYNTPDPLSPGIVDKVDTLEVATRPSTPTQNPEDTPSTPATPVTPAPPPASIRYRRRTSSATKSRDRNPSEDAAATAQHGSRCTTPTLEKNFDEVLPFEPRKFPITDNEYASMAEMMPAGYFDIGKDKKENQTTEEKETKAETPAISSSVIKTSPNSSTCEENWKPDEDPEDPEWNIEKDSTTSNNSKSSVSGSNNSKSSIAKRKAPSLSTLKMAKPK